MQKIASLYRIQKTLFRHSYSHYLPFSYSKSYVESIGNRACHSNYQQSFDNKLETTSNTIGDENISDVHEQQMIDHEDSIEFGIETVPYGEMNDCVTSNKTEATATEIKTIRPRSY